ncbi:MAG: HAD hydrolase-like protein [Pseudonocardia sp.]|nr:HAD hydrolase-like protein [Pseudonocardia sp.]
MRLTGVDDPAHVLVAGDTVLDVRAGHAAGAGLVVAVLTGAQSHDELAAEHQPNTPPTSCPASARSPPSATRCASACRHFGRTDGNAPGPQGPRGISVDLIRSDQISYRRSRPRRPTGRRCRTGRRPSRRSSTRRSRRR